MMRVPFASPLRAYEAERTDIDRAVSSVLAGGWYVLGPVVEKFEEDFAAYVGVPHALGVASGTDALALAIRSLGLGPGDEIITAANAGGYATTACVQVGVTPVYVDVCEPTLTIDPDAVAGMIGPRTKAIIATHLYGSMADVERLVHIARDAGVRLIEDCAQAHGARAGDRMAGSFGDVATFSFYPTKNLGGLGDGGAVVCRDEGLAETLREMRQYGWRGKYRVARSGGMNSRLDPVQAAVLRVRLPKLDDANMRRRALVDRIEARLGPLGMPVCRAERERYVGHLCVIRIQGRDKLRAQLDVQGIGSDIHYPLLDVDQRGWMDIGWRSGELSVSRRAAGEILSLPLFPELADPEVDAVCDAVEVAVRGATSGQPA